MPKTFFRVVSSKTEYRLPLKNLLDHLIRHRRRDKMELFGCGGRRCGVRLFCGIQAGGPIINGFLRGSGINSIVLCHSELVPILMAARARASKSYFSYWCVIPGLFTFTIALSFRRTGHSPPPCSGALPSDFVHNAELKKQHLLDKAADVCIMQHCETNS